MPKTEMVQEWFDAVEELEENDPKSYEEIEDYADKQWISAIADELEVADDPLTLIQNYLDFISAKGRNKKQKKRYRKMKNK